MKSPDSEQCEFIHLNKNKMEDLKKRMIRNAMQYNIYLTEWYLSRKPLKVILSFTHPLERKKFTQELEILTAFEQRKEAENVSL